MTNTHTYNYQEIKDRLEGQKQSLLHKLQTQALTEQEREAIQMSIDNYQYILDLVEMNHFGRGIHY
ncbi:DUF3896 family protein [Ectobacillus ponti]|uniref:DUF3896 domain-containing protein n=1 Tax=Ectobacillus ponti TaxID=2961894 RepID=A0AA41XBA7_9BACI|nr:DUF3896 family protein [Ectobacillus ponti]MCP8968881.1 DUF3896 domain-containing protein [Ectobacillus ponti]